MKLFLLSVIALKLASAAPIVASSSNLIPASDPEIILSGHAKRALPPAYNPAIPGWVSKEDDGFIVDIPYPKHLIPQTPRERPIFKVTLPDTVRPKSRLSSSYGSGSTLQSVMSSPGDASESGSGKGHVKRDITTQHHEKRGLVGFAVSNSPFIIGGAAAAGGGLWLWERYLRTRAARIARQKAIRGDGKNTDNVDAKPGPVRPTGSNKKRDLKNEDEVEIVADKAEQLETISQSKCACVKCECRCWCTDGNCGKDDHEKKKAVAKELGEEEDEEEKRQCGCGAMQR